MSYNSKYTGAEVEALLDAANGKQDAIEDLDAIRAGAAKGATALQSVPAEYVTESELEDKGYATTAQLNDKQDKITDLDAIRSGASKGATALQEEQYKGTATGVLFYGTKYDADSSGIVHMGYPDVGAVRKITVNGSTKTPTDGAVDLGTFLTQHQDISQKADLNNGKIVISQLPDYILGQVMYGGVINSGDANNIVVQPSVNYKTKYSLEGSTVTVGKYQFWSQQGVYFIAGVNGAFFDIEVKVGDWLISTGTNVAKVDNTDAVSSVAGLTGVIDASALGKELSYNDFKDKPTIPSAVTESTVSGWGFTKNTGTYSKPSGGIPKTDLASAVQTSLGKADTAVQPDAISEFLTAEDLAGVASSGSYNDLIDTPTIPTAVTESTVSGWGFTKNAGTITGIKMNGASKGTSGVVDLGTVITSHQDISGKADKSSLATVATSGSYNDLSNKPTIPSAITESIVSGWGFTKNTGTYSKPSGGIPKTDLASAVQTSLGKADSAVIASIQGDYRFAENTDGMVSRGKVIYALPDSVNDYTSEDDVIVTANTLKTINGQSLIGEGDITISGGGDSSVFITHFTVTDFIRGNIEFTDEQVDAIRDAARQNKIIAVSNEGDRGFIVSGCYYIESDNYWNLKLTIIHNGASYNNDMNISAPYFRWAGLQISPFRPLVEYTSVDEDGGAVVDSYNKDNLIVIVEGECRYLQIGEVGYDYGMTVRFFTGEDCTIEYWGNWANGVIPTIESYTAYEMSIVAGADSTPCAVLTPFKLVE